MEDLITALVFASVALVVVGVGALVPAGSQVVRRRLKSPTGRAPKTRQEQRERRERIASVMEDLGDRLRPGVQQRDTVHQLLRRAGYRSSNAVAAYFGIRATMMFGLGAVVGGLGYVLGLEGRTAAYLAGVTIALGWLLPRFYLKRRIRLRQKELQKALADALDLMVVGVEAGLGLNQALQRVAEEIGPVSEAMSDELSLVNLQIRAGSSREEALRELGERTDVPDLRALAAMLIQTDRFGTSIARALRIHAETLRTKRRQRAEEAAAKTTIKLIFPLALFIFPSMFVVILGPAFMIFFDVMKDIG